MSARLHRTPLEVTTHLISVSLPITALIIQKSLYKTETILTDQTGSQAKRHMRKYNGIPKEHFPSVFKGMSVAF